MQTLGRKLERYLLDVWHLKACLLLKEWILKVLVGTQQSISVRYWWPCMFLVSPTSCQAHLTMGIRFLGSQAGRINILIVLKSVLRKKEKELSFPPLLSAKLHVIVDRAEGGFCLLSCIQYNSGKLCQITMTYGDPTEFSKGETFSLPLPSSA